MIYFTADNHFCHGNIIGSCMRPFSNVNDFYPVSIKQILEKVELNKNEDSSFKPF